MQVNLPFVFKIKLLLQNVINPLEQFFSCSVCKDPEIRISFDHGGELALFWSVKDKDWFSQAFCICEFIANAQRWLCAFRNDKIAFFEPVCILGVDEIVSVSFLFMDGSGEISYMFG